VTAAFNRLFSTYPQFATADFNEVVGAYFDAVEPYETQDVLVAVKNFLSGSAPGHNPAFAPSAPLVGAESRRVMNQRLDSEARQRKRALPAPDIVHTPEERARVSAMVEDLKRRTAEQMRTEDAAADLRMRDLSARTNARFFPDQDPMAMKRRLGFAAGDPEGDRDVA